MLPGPEIVGKYLELVKDAVPTASRVAILWSESSALHPVMVREAARPAHALGLRLQPAGFRSAGDFEAAFAAMTKERAEAVIALPDPTTFVHRKQLADLALRHRLPALLTHLEGAADGSLMAYSTNVSELFRRSASYVDRMMRGAKAGDLPIEQPTKFELAINLRTAGTLGLTIAPLLLLRADQVIE